MQESAFRRLLLLMYAILLMAPDIQAKRGHTLAGRNVDVYTVVYDASADADEGLTPAKYLQTRLMSIAGAACVVLPDSVTLKGPVISIVRPDDMATFEYSVAINRRGITVAGGSGWAINKAIDELLTHVDGSNKIHIAGTVDGEMLFPRRDDVNLRILDDNIWNYSRDTIPAVWRAAGIDCRDAARAPEYAQLVRAYMPDVVTLQEYNRHMHPELYPRIEKYGYRMAYDPGDGVWNFTPIFYNADSLELVTVNYNLYTPRRWSDSNSKSFTSAVFRMKSNGRVFAVINTHLWWKSDRLQPGSTQARAAQVRYIMAEADIIKQKYDCPIFVVGDMNSTEESIPMQQFVNAGYVPCYKAATVYADMSNGYHACSPRTVGSRVTSFAADRQTGAIDHCFIYNAGDAEVKVFDCIREYFTVKLTDHYPNLVDARL